MLANLHALPEKVAFIPAPPLRKVQELAAKSRFENPKIATFPIDGMKVSDPITLAGNG